MWYLWSTNWLLTSPTLASHRPVRRKKHREFGSRIHYTSSLSLIISLSPPPPAGWMTKLFKLCSSYWHSSFLTLKGYNHQQVNGFETHSGQFIQVLNFRRSHWIVVSNLGYESNAVNMYDTMHCSILPSTVETVARLAFCFFPNLTIRMVKVDLQRNLSDCGVLSKAMALD